MAKLLNLTITRIDGPVFEGEIDSVTLPGVDGEFTLLAEHEPFISLLCEGKIIVRTGGEERDFHIEEGLLEMSQNTATVLL